jgi:hypothetical protein
MQAPTAVEQRELVSRVLASNLFSKSHRLAAFLRFICDQYDQGHASSINEQRIGVEVFARSPGYHVGEDSIVRSQARFLRLRLDEYFATEGRNEPIILSIPKGSYVPAFASKPVEKTEPRFDTPAIVDLVIPVDTKAARRKRSVQGLAIALITVSFIAGTMLYRTFGLRHPQSTEDTQLVEAFWSSLFTTQRPLLVIPSDSSLVLLEEMTGKPVTLQAYASRTYLNPVPAENADLWRSIATSQYTNMADLNTVGRLANLPESNGVPLTMRFARDLSLKELKESNAILIGGARSNPWVTLFAPLTNFDIDYDYQTKQNFVRNRAPQRGEEPLYIEERAIPTEPSRSYGVVTYVASLDGQGHTLLLEGTSKAGTESAAEFLAGSAFAEFLKTMRPAGRSIPSFEVLIETSSMAGASYHPEIVCWHTLRTTMRIPAQ